MDSIRKGFDALRMETAQVQQHLTDLGFSPGGIDGIEGPMTRTGVARFQLAYNRGRLTVDAIAGPKTWAAIRDATGQNGLLSDHFRARELQSKGDGSCWIHRDLLAALEELRKNVGRPLVLRSAWRDVAHNRSVGGATASQHTYGAAAELDAISVRLSAGAHIFAGRAADFDQGYVTLDDCRDLKIFSGLGHRNGWVTHVDVRTSRSPSSPSVWQYG